MIATTLLLILLDVYCNFEVQFAILGAKLVPVVAG
jgi:hypothetical protein